MHRKLLPYIWMLAGASLIHADEGIWLLSNFPKDQVKKEHGFAVTDVFLNKLQTASVRLNNGGSGSFVSPDGLIFTNHHVASDCIQKVSTEANDYMKSGFYAPTREQEKACPDMEVNTLLKIEDVTAKVKEGVSDGMDSAEANRLKKAAMTRIEKECNSSTGNRCDVVTFYSGGLYHLYQYKKYTDIRLVLAPELAVAAFGGDPDNFTFPRYCLDATFLRAYENGKPASTPNHLKWSKTGVREGELAFVSGHPGTTGRLATLAELEFFRDVSYPYILDLLSSIIDRLKSFSAESAENKRIAADNLFSQQNSFKAYTGFLAGLRQDSLMSRKQDEEKTLQSKVDKEKFATTWSDVAAAYEEYKKFYKPYYLLERIPVRGSELFPIARDILRYGVEKQKPNEKRLREYVDTALPSLEQGMFSEAPIYEGMEIAVLEVYLHNLIKAFGRDDELVKQILAGRTPEKAAKEILASTKLQSVEERKKLAADPKLAAASEDGMLKLARLIDPRARALRQRYEDKIEAVIQASASKIAQARFSVYGSQDYPDATFTLRVSYGPVKGYGNTPYATRMGGMYKRATGVEPYALPDRWLKAKSRLALNTPYNFVTTADTHGGNSGSPTVNTKGEVIGILFDGNIESLPNRFVYRDRVERSVHVASQGIVESLKKVYNASSLLSELGVI